MRGVVELDENSTNVDIELREIREVEVLLILVFVLGMIIWFT